jgi:NADH-quinone oxidoreductase subunit M
MLSLLGSYNPAPGLDPTLFRILMVGGGIGTVLTAGYLLWLVQRVVQGRTPESFAGVVMHDVETLEWISWAPLIGLILVAGLYPKIITSITEGAVQNLVGVFAR